MDPGVYEARGQRITVHEVAWPLAIYSKGTGGRKVTISSALSKLLLSEGYKKRSGK